MRHLIAMSDKYYGKLAKVYQVFHPIYRKHECCRSLQVLGLKI